MGDYSTSTSTVGFQVTSTSPDDANVLTGTASVAADGSQEQVFGAAGENNQGAFNSVVVMAAPDGTKASTSFTTDSNGNSSEVTITQTPNGSSTWVVTETDSDGNSKTTTSTYDGNRQQTSQSTNSDGQGSSTNQSSQSSSDQSSSQSQSSDNNQQSSSDQSSGDGSDKGPPPGDDGMANPDGTDERPVWHRATATTMNSQVTPSEVTTVVSTAAAD